MTQLRWVSVAFLVIVAEGAASVVLTGAVGVEEACAVKVLIVAEVDILVF